MSRTAIVISVEASNLSVLPVSKLECASCSAPCIKKQEAVPASNPKGLSLKAGELVYIEANSRRQRAEALFSLLFPFLSALAGYFAAAPLAASFSGRAADGVRALAVLVFLFISSALVLLLTRFFPSKGRIEIVGLASSDGRSSR